MIICFKTVSHYVVLQHSDYTLYFFLFAVQHNNEYTSKIIQNTLLTHTRKQYTHHTLYEHTYTKIKQ